MRSEIDLDERRRGEDTLFSVPNPRSFLHVNRRFIGRTRPRGCSSLRDERSGVAGGTKVPGRSNEAASGKQEAVCGCRSVYTQHSSVENEKKKGWVSVGRERTRKIERDRRSRDTGERDSLPIRYRRIEMKTKQAHLPPIRSHPSSRRRRAIDN